MGNVSLCDGNERACIALHQHASRTHADTMTSQCKKVAPDYMPSETQLACTWRPKIAGIPAEQGFGRRKIRVLPARASPSGF
ncbi:hypothetical protein SAMN05216345_11130 [Cupriavidus sp. YR651]|nr:hypothetical protein SAMN05216345_11130 [Cupriavidus sp. YR651]